MAGLADLVQFTTTASGPITIGNVTVTPRSSAVVIRLPIGGFVWNRPTGITVRRGDVTEDIPIRDVTRIVQLVLLGMTALMLIAGSLIGSTTRRRHRNG